MVFSDIYGTKIFHSRLTEILLAIKAGIPVIILPQTIGPFVEKDNRELAHYILKSASKIYVRDDKYIDELDKLNLAYERSRDLSCYMKPEPVNIDIEENAIGINVSGLAYFNRFTGLEGQFDNYPKLLSIIIGKFQKMKVPVYLIPHSYIANNPLASGDDMLACKEVYEAATDKTGLYWVDKDLKSPQVKYVISQMNFFIGTRMHANFAAIYTGVPLYGLGYSYKFEGAFRENGVYDNNVSLINNISAEQCEEIANRVIEYYKKSSIIEWIQKLLLFICHSIIPHRIMTNGGERDSQSGPMWVKQRNYTLVIISRKYRLTWAIMTYAYRKLEKNRLN